MEGRCPNCGYCPHCGRGSSDPYPVVRFGGDSEYWEDADSSINNDRLVIHEEIGEDSVVDEEVDWV